MLPLAGLTLPTARKSNFLTGAVFNPIALAVAMDASFVARAFCGDIDGTAEIMKQAVRHKGFALVDVFQPCVSFNKTNTLQWFKEKTYALGVFYINKKPTFEENLGLHREGRSSGSIPKNS